LRLTNQFRQRSSMIYELRGGGARLTIAIRGRESQDDPAAYRVEARTGSSTDEGGVVAWGETRALGLQSVVELWGQQLEAEVYDWRRVTELLESVKAV
jgi:hypothetical protein